VSPSSVIAGPRPPRLGIVDAVRGLACVAMIVWHTADAWLTPEIHGAWLFERARMIGGFAAPFFLSLAGLSLALSTELRPTRARTTSALVRAGWVVVVGYALKLFAWTVDHAAILVPRCFATILLSLTAMTGLVLAFREPSKLGARDRIVLGVISAPLLAFVYAHVDGLRRLPQVLTRLDVLHGIGAALAVLALTLHGLGRVVPNERVRAVVLVILAFAVTLATPHFLGVSLDPLPTRLADYVARTSLEATASGARFSLFPWLGHTLLGAAIGTMLRASPREVALTDVPFTSRPWLLGAIATLVAIALWEGGAIAVAITTHSESLRSTVRLAFYASALLGCAGWLGTIGPRVRPLHDGLSFMGKSSLLVYGAHLEIAYGLLGVPMRGVLGWTGWAIGAALLTLSMIALARAAEVHEARVARRNRGAA